MGHRPAGAPSAAIPHGGIHAGLPGRAVHNRRPAHSDHLRPERDPKGHRTPDRGRFGLWRQRIGDHRAAARHLHGQREPAWHVLDLGELGGSYPRGRTLRQGYRHHHRQRRQARNHHRPGLGHRGRLRQHQYDLHSDPGPSRFRGGCGQLCQPQTVRLQPGRTIPP